MVPISVLPLCVCFHLASLGIRSMESLMIHSNKDGTYSATWTPSTPGLYSVQVYIEGSPAGIGWCGQNKYEMPSAI